VKTSTSFANYWKVQQIFKIKKLGKKNQKTKKIKFLDFPLPTFQVPKINNNNNNNIFLNKKFKTKFKMIDKRKW